MDDPVRRPFERRGRFIEYSASSHKRLAPGTLAAGVCVAALFTAPALGQTTASGGPAVSEVVVTASRADLLGAAISASQGSVTAKEVELRPIYRVGQLY